MTPYLDGALPPQDDARVAAHLVHCGGCLTYLDQMRSMVAVLGHLDPKQPPEAVIDRLMCLYRRHHAG